MRRRSGSTAVITVLALVLASTAVLAGSVPAAAAPADGGRYEAVTPARILDTRVGTGAAKHAAPAHGSVTFPITGVGGVPAAGVAAVVFNLVVTDARAAGYAVAYPAGDPRPATSTVNFAAGDTVAHEAVVQGGKATVYNGSDETVELVADVSGYLTAGSPTAGGEVGVSGPARVLDTRNGTGAPRAPVTNGKTVQFTVRGQGGVPASGVSGVLVNLTVTGASAAGYLVAASALTSVLNFPAGTTVSNFAVLPLDADGRVSVTPKLGTRSASVEVVADVLGWVHAGDPAGAGEVQPFAPGRLLDTRTSGQHTVPAHGSLSLAVAGVSGIPADDVTAAALDITAVAPRAPGYLIAYPSGADQPKASTLNFDRTTRAAETLVPVASNGSVVLANESAAALNVVVDSSAFVAPVVDPGPWSARTQLTSGTPDARGSFEYYHAASCPTTTYCVAVDSAGDGRGTVVYNGSTWSASSALPDGPEDLSCPSPSTCFAIVGTPPDDGGNGAYVVARGGSSWSRVSGVGGGNEELDTLSCVSATFCAATGFDVADNPAGGPSVWTWNGSAWSRFDLPFVPRVAQVSCVSDTFCAVVDDGDAAIWTGSWKLRTGLFTSAGDATVTCASRTYCLAVVGSQSRVFDGTDWSAPVTLPTKEQVGRPACYGTGECLVPVTVGSPGSTAQPGELDDGIAAVQGNTWGTPVAVDPVASPDEYAGGITGLQCPSATACLLLDGYGGSQRTT